MTAAGIGAGVHYRSLAQQLFYQERFGWDPADYPVSTTFGDETVSLPLGSKLADDEIEKIIDKTTAVLSTQVV